jgi:alpha-D-ribose 1-methylphosphonate 5-triphosphate diphosphatase
MGAWPAPAGSTIAKPSRSAEAVEHVVEAFECGATLAEMPLSLESARKAKELAMMVLMGAPNDDRGGPHCGNLCCHDAMAEDLVDMIGSDGHFPSLLAGALPMIDAGMRSSAAINLLTGNPARHLGLDREAGSMEPGKRADLAAFHPRFGDADLIGARVAGRQRFGASTLRQGAATSRSPVEEDMADLASPGAHILAGRR